MASLFMRFPGGKARTVTLSYDDGVVQDIRLMKIMNRHGLKGTFNLSPGCFKEKESDQGFGMTREQALEYYADSGHEVALHGLTHPCLDQLPPERATYEVIENRRQLEQMFGHTMRGMAYPYGATNDVVVQILKNAGIAYSRATGINEDFQMPTDWLRLSATTKHTNPRLPELVEKFLNTATCLPLMFYLWGHSYEFDNDNNWEVVERFAEQIGGEEGIWYATNIEIYDYVAAYQQLRFTVDMDLAENPTATDLYFEYDGKPYMVKAGQMLKLD